MEKKEFTKFKYEVGDTLWISGAWEQGESAFKGIVLEQITDHHTTIEGKKWRMEKYKVSVPKDHDGMGNGYRIVFAGHILANYLNDEEMHKYGRPKKKTNEENIKWKHYTQT